MTRVPYKRLARAERDAREQFPHALRVHALWTPASANAEIHVEVYSEQARAKVHAWKPSR